MVCKMSVVAVSLLAAAFQPVSSLASSGGVAEVLARIGAATLDARYDEALELADAGARAAADPCDVARFRVAAARAAVDRSTFRGDGDPLEHAQAAAAAAALCGQPQVVAAAADGLGRAHYGRTLTGREEDFTKADEHFRAALALREEHGDDGDVAESLFHVGLVHEQQEQAGEAAKLYREALARALRAGDEVILSYVYRHLASFERATRGAEGELDLHQRSRALREKAGFRAAVPFSRLAEGDLLVELGRPTLAIATWEKARTEAQGAGLHRAVLYTSLALAAHREEAGDRPQARADYGRAAAAAQEIGDAGSLKSAHEALARLRR